MPSFDTSPNFMLMSDFDARNFTSTLYTRAGSNIALDVNGRVIFDDPILFLNGNGQSSTKSLKYYLEADKGGTWTISINPSDKIVWSKDTSESMDIDTYLGGDLWGLENDHIVMNATSVIFPNDFARGNLILWASNNSLYGRITYTNASSVSPSIYPTFPVAQNMMSLLRERIGDEIYCLQSVEEALFSDYVQWVLRDDGRVMQIVNYPSNNNLINFAWVDTTFRDRLGFNGLEEWQTLYGRKVLIANNVMPGILAPSRPYADHHLAFDRVSDLRRKGDGSFGSNFKGNFVKSILNFHLDGLADSQDDYMRFAFDLGAYIYQGSKVTLVQEVGESRLNRRTSEITSSNPAYSLTHTSELNGLHGMIRGTVLSFTNDLPFENRIMRRIPISMEIAHD